MFFRPGFRLVALTAALCGGCNLVFGIQGGELTGPGGGAATSSSSSGAGASGTGGAEGMLVVSPSKTTLIAQTSLELAATVGGTGVPVAWKVVEPGGGTITPSGTGASTALYAAPAATGTFHVEATTMTGPPRTATAELDVVQMVAPVVLSTTGDVPTATGHGTQSHLAYAQGTGQWWLFRDPSGTGSLATMYSDDFTSWTAGTSVTLPQGHSGDGRDLSVAYRQLGGHDVVHVSQGFASPSDPSNLGRYHLRATLAHDQITFGTVQTINPGGAMTGGSTPDGTATIILPSGLVIDTTGYQSTPTLNPPPGLTSNCGGGDVDVYTSDVVDDGASGFDKAVFSPAVLWCVPSVVQARQLLLFQGNAVLLYVDGGSVTQTGNNTNILMDYRDSSSGMWSPDEGGATMMPPSVFAKNTDTDIDDWTAAVQGGAIHVVRRVGSLFEHRVTTALTTSSMDWVNGHAIPQQQTLSASGLFLAPYGAGLILLAIGSSGSEILYTSFDGDAWSPWATLCLTAGGSNYLSGFAPESGPKPAVIWTQTAGTSYAIAGFQLP